MGMSTSTFLTENNDELNGSQGMPGASISPEVRVPKVQNSKIWVLVRQKHLPIENRRWNSDSGDTAGTFVTEYSWSDLEKIEPIKKEYLKSWHKKYGMTHHFRVGVH